MGVGVGAVVLLIVWKCKLLILDLHTIMLTPHLDLFYPYAPAFLRVVDVPERELCTMKLKAKDVLRFHDIIEDLYYFEIIIGERK